MILLICKETEKTDVEYLFFLYFKANIYIKIVNIGKSKMMTLGLHKIVYIMQNDWQKNKIGV